MNTSQDSDIDQKLKERMEVISPQEVTLVKFLGSGGYGEVYLGKWQHSEAAVKCLNPSLFFTGGLVSDVSLSLRLFHSLIVDGADSFMLVCPPQHRGV